jgi:hypothetical protein
VPSVINHNIEVHAYHWVTFERDPAIVYGFMGLRTHGSPGRVVTGESEALRLSCDGMFPGSQIRRPLRACPLSHPLSGEVSK